MKNLKILNWILLFLGYTGLTIGAVLVFLYHFQLRQEKILYNETQEQFANTVNSIIKLNTSVLSQVVFDYTYWDEFVEETESVDTSWYENNITTLLKSFHVDNVCVYNKHSKLLHESSADNFLLSTLITPEILKKLSQVKFLHYYFIMAGEVYEISCATIHGENDPTHTQTPHSGFFFLGKKWSKTYIAELETLTGSKFGMADNDSAQLSRKSFIIQASVLLKGWDEKPALNIIFSKELTSLKQYHLQSLYLAYMVIGAFLLVLGMFYFNFRRLVINPLNLVTGCLKTENPQQIELLKNSKGEFRLIGQLISEFISQKQQLILTKEQAEESDRLKSAFLANISHEIRTPMNGILGFAELLKEPNLTGEELQHFISTIKMSSDRMLNTINDIVDISKIESGQMEVVVSETNIFEQVKFIRNLFKSEAEQKGLNLFFTTFSPHDQSYVNTDREKLFAILSNLVKNAIKYTDSGSIELGYILKTSGEIAEPGIMKLTERWRLSKAETNRSPVFEFFVKDTGIGIPKERQEAVFERFVQADIGDKRAFQGAGLGLSITKAYVEMLGGRIWLNSTMGKGSEFYFTIPCLEQSQDFIPNQEVIPSFEEEEPVNPKKTRLKILIAEDDEASVMFIARALGLMSKEILKARTGFEAVEICRSNPDIDLVLMDIKMPGLNGYEATRQIRQFDPTVIIIAQTAYGMTGDKEKALEAGCNDYISKPVRKDELIELILKHFKKQENE